jgi:D-arabinose 1-dehydrogenase-like Zn-dependent alcohol dehydrogenase
MRAVVLDAKDAPFRVEERSLPVPEAPGTVLLKVAACGVCYRDLIDRKGLYPFSSFPRVLGHEIAGEVLAFGPGVSDFQIGDKVVTTHHDACGACPACREGEEVRCERGFFSYAMTVDGGYQEAVIAHASTLVKVPDGLDLAKASFLHCTAAVAARAIFHRGRLQFGETVLVTGASGGVGIHALQLLRLAGARTIAATTSEAKVAALKQHGAHEIVVLREGVKLQDEVKRLTDGRGCDMALELTGAPTWNASVRSVRRGGRVVLVGNVTTERVELNPGYAILNEIAILGSAGASRADLAQVLDRAARGELTPVMAGTLPLEKAEEAHARLKGKGVTGRLVLVP